MKLLYQKPQSLNRGTAVNSLDAAAVISYTVGKGGSV